MNNNKYDYKFFYDKDNNLQLFLPLRVYFDNTFGDFYKIEPQAKLLHLGYVLSHGFDLSAHLKKAMTEDEQLTAETVKQTIIEYIVYLRSGATLDFTNGFLDNVLDDDQVLKLFIDELLLRYILPENSGMHYLKELHWDYKQITEQEGMTNEKFKEIVISPSKDIDYTVEEVRLRHILMEK